MKTTRTPTQEWNAVHLSIIETNTDSFDAELYTPEPIDLVSPFSFMDKKILIPQSTKLLLQNTEENKNNRNRATLYTDIENLDEAKLFITYYVYYKGKGRTDIDHFYFIFKDLPQQIVTGESWNKESLILSDPYNFSLRDTLAIRFPQQLGILSLNDKQEISVTYNDKTINLIPSKSSLLDKKGSNVSIQQKLPKRIPRGATHTGKVEYETQDFGSILFETEIKITNDGLTKIEME